MLSNYKNGAKKPRHFKPPHEVSAHFPKVRWLCVGHEGHGELGFCGRRQKNVWEDIFRSACFSGEKKKSTRVSHFMLG